VVNNSPMPQGLCFNSANFRYGREDSPRRLAISVKSSRSSRSALSWAMPARTAFCSRFGRAFNAVKKISAVA